MIGETKSGYRNTLIAFTLYAIIFVLLMVQSNFVSRTSLIVLYLVIIAFVYGLRKREFMPLKWGKPTLFGVFFGSIMISAIFLVNLQIGWTKILDVSSKPAMFFVGAMILQALVSIGEELSFRELILRNFMIEMNATSAIAISSIMFAVIHIPSILKQGMEIEYNIIMIITLALNGVLFAMLYIKYGLYASIGFHFAWNFLQYNVFALKAGFSSLLELSYQGSHIFNGGQYGPEAGLIGILSMSLGIVAVAWFKRSQDKTN